MPEPGEGSAPVRASISTAAVHRDGVRSDQEHTTPAGSAVADRPLPPGVSRRRRAPVLPLVPIAWPRRRGLVETSLVRTVVACYCIAVSVLMVIWW